MATHLLEFSLPGDTNGNGIYGPGLDGSGCSPTPHSQRWGVTENIKV